MTRLRTLLLALTALAVSGAAFPVPQALADSAVAPKSGTVTVTGAGWGHGRGMSQYGAWGAALEGVKYDKILAFYYPKTSLTSLPASNSVRVWVTGAGSKLYLRPDKGLKVQDSAGVALTLPRGAAYTKWRISRVSGKRVLAYRNQAGKYVTYPTKLDPKRNWQASNPTSKKVRIATPSGTTRTYHGAMAIRVHSSGAVRVVNTVPMESYLRSVVPAEMPASWHTEALKAQSVAARTYAARLRERAASGAVYDLCDTSACQVYKPATTSHSRTDAAIKATATKVLSYAGKMALTEFSSSNGGWSANGGLAYQVAQRDPYDAAKNPNRSWTKQLTSATIQKAYPSIGTLRTVQITERDGDGNWGGRVEKVKITGSKTSVTITGGSFKSKFGLKERYFTLSGGPVVTLSANLQRWTDLGGASGTLGAQVGKEVDVTGLDASGKTVTGKRAQFTNGELWWSSATGSHLLSGKVLQAFLDLGGAAKVGFPSTDVTTVSTSTSAQFAWQTGTQIVCPASGDCVRYFG